MCIFHAISILYLPYSYVLPIIIKVYKCIFVCDYMMTQTNNNFSNDQELLKFVKWIYSYKILLADRYECITIFHKIKWEIIKYVLVYVHRVDRQIEMYIETERVNL